MLRGLAEFREHLGGQLTIMLLKGIGQPFDVHEIQRDTMVRSIEVLAGDRGRRLGAAGLKAGRLRPVRRGVGPAPYEADYFIDRLGPTRASAASTGALDIGEGRS